MHRVTRALLLALTLTVIATGQEDRTLHIRQLKLSSSREISAPPFRYMGNAQCDESGLMYFLLGSGFDVSVMRLDPRTGQPVLFTDKQEDTYLREWYPRDRGVVALVEGAASIHTAILFDSDGNVTQRTKLNLPAAFHATSFVTFSSGTFFVEGYIDKSDATAGEKRVRAFLLKSDGTLLKEVTVPTSAGQQNPEGAFFKVGGATYADGRLYVLGADRLFILSETGELMETVKLQKPEADMRPRRAMVSDGTIAVEYTQVEGGGDVGKIISTYVLLHGTPIETLGAYRPNEELNNRAACFQHGEFSFISFASGKIVLKTSQLR